MLKNTWFPKDRLSNALWLNALSLIYAKRIGEKVVLHTDDLGAEYFEVLPYDEVLLSLGSIDSLNTRWWAMGKLKALELEPPSSIHIDGDVFLRDEKKMTALFSSDYDIVCQMEEGESWFDWSYAPQIPYFDKVLNGQKIIGYKAAPIAFNGGVLGIKSVSLRKTYFEEAWKLVDACERKPKIVAQLDGVHEQSIVVEQHLLAGLAHINHAKVEYVIPPELVKRKGSMYEAMNEVNYLHLWGLMKSRPKIMSIVKEKVKRMDSKLHAKIEKHCTYITKNNLQPIKEIEL